MNSHSVAIYGAGYLGRQMLHHLDAHLPHCAEVLGFIDDTIDPGLEILSGRESLGSLADIQHNKRFGPNSLQIVFAIGYSSMIARRTALNSVLSSGYKLFSIIHPQAIIEPGARIGAGSVVLGGAIVDQGVTTGEACFVDIGVRLGAETVIGHNNYLSSGTSTGSRVQIGDDCFFGMDCTITTDVRIGSNLFVNAKSLIARDVGDNTKFVELHKSKQLPISPR